MSTELQITGISPAMIGGFVLLIVVIAAVVFFFNGKGTSLLDDDSVKFVKKFKKVVDDPMVANSGRMTIKVVEDYIELLESDVADADASDKAKKWAKDNISETGLLLLRNSITDQIKSLTTTLAQLKILDKQVKEINADKSTDKCEYMRVNADKFNELVNADISGPDRTDLFQTLFEVKTLRETLKLDECTKSGKTGVRAIVDQIESGTADPVGVLDSSLELCPIAKTPGFVDNFTEEKYKKFAENLVGMCGTREWTEDERNRFIVVHNDAKTIKDLTANSATATKDQWCDSNVHQYSEFVDLPIPSEMINSPIEPMYKYVKAAVKGALETGKVPAAATCPPRPRSTP